jgi:hypothetical protein
MPAKVAVIITSPDVDVVWTGLFYAIKGTRNGFMDDLRLVLWGPAERTIAESTELQEMVKEYQGLGKSVLACKTCSDRYGVTEEMEKLGCVVDYVGSIVSQWIKDEFTLFNW